MRSNTGGGPWQVRVSPLGKALRAMPRVLDGSPAGAQGGGGGGGGPPPPPSSRQEHARADGGWRPPPGARPPPRYDGGPPLGAADGPWSDSRSKRPRLAPAPSLSSRESITSTTHAPGGGASFSRCPMLLSTLSSSPHTPACTHSLDAQPRQTHASQLPIPWGTPPPPPPYPRRASAFRTAPRLLRATLRWPKPQRSLSRPSTGAWHLSPHGRIVRWNRQRTCRRWKTRPLTNSMR